MLRKSHRCCNLFGNLTSLDSRSLCYLAGLSLARRFGRQFAFCVDIEFGKLAYDWKISYSIGLKENLIFGSILDRLINYYRQCYIFVYLNFFVIVKYLKTIISDQSQFKTRKQQYFCEYINENFSAEIKKVATFSLYCFFHFRITN